MSRILEKTKEAVMLALKVDRTTRHDVDIFYLHERSKSKLSSAEHTEIRIHIWADGREIGKSPIYMHWILDGTEESAKEAEKCSELLMALLEDKEK